MFANFALPPSPPCSSSQSPPSSPYALWACLDDNVWLAALRGKGEGQKDKIAD